MLKNIWRKGAGGWVLAAFSVIATAIFVGAAAFVIAHAGRSNSQPGDGMSVAEVVYIGSSALIGLLALFGLAVVLRHFLLPGRTVGGLPRWAVFLVVWCGIFMTGFMVVYHRALFR